MATNYDILRSRLESEQKRLTHELEQLKASVRPADERREGSPFGKREEEAAAARVALSARPPPKLIIYSPCLMPLRAQNM